MLLCIQDYSNDVWIISLAPEYYRLRSTQDDDQDLDGSSYLKEKSPLSTFKNRLELGSRGLHL
jgi:hypothetical protein